MFLLKTVFPFNITMLKFTAIAVYKGKILQTRQNGFKKLVA